jgi:hypothetical protein
MPAPKIQVKSFIFASGEAIELPAHWIPFQVVKHAPITSHRAGIFEPGKTEIWAYRNGNA